MSVGNSLQQDQRQPRFSVAMQREDYKKLVNDTLGDPNRARRFVAAVTSAVAVNPALQMCDPGSVLSAALLGESLNLSPSPQLGQYYMVPYKQKAKYDREGNMISPEKSLAQFQLGYKGMVQLAIRSGQYLDIDVFDVREGEYLGRDKMTRRPMFTFVENDEEREALPVVGYYAYFELLNGFRKCLYWSREKVELHADRFSQAFNLKAFKQMKEGLIAQKDMWKYSSYWYKDFDSMASKTMLRQLISKWGIMSIDLQKAVISDEAVIKPDLTPEYFGDDPEGGLPPMLPGGGGEASLPPDSGEAPDVPPAQGNGGMEPPEGGRGGTGTDPLSFFDEEGGGA